MRAPSKLACQFRRVALLGLVLAVGVAGCTSIPVGSLWQLRKFDFEAFDPAELRLALNLPDTLALGPQGLRVSVKVTRGSAEVPTEHSYWLREREARAPMAGLPMVAHRAQRWVVLQLDATDAQRMQRMRDQLMATKAADGQGKSSVEINAEPRLCSRGAGPEPTARVSAAVRWREDPGYVILLDGKSLKELNAMVDAPPGALPRCDTAPSMQ